MTKPLHPGLVGRNAIIAARLAQNGFTADASQLEAKLGYFALFGVDSDLSIVEAALAKHWALLSEGINVKKYPCCYNTHRTADATLSLSRKVDLSHGVDRITLTMEPGGLDPLIHHRPVTGLEAKFSGEYVVGAGLVDGLIGLDSFTDSSVQRPAVQELLRRVEVVESAKPPFGGEQFEFAYAAVEVESGGHVLRERVDIPKGDARSPLNDAEIDAKFRDCLAFSKDVWDAGALLTELRELHNSHRLGGFEHMVERELVPHVQEVDVSVE
jgi:2-methylcitrate dehydratase PrpD